jgi:hypothetical protein
VWPGGFHAFDRSPDARISKAAVAARYNWRERLLATDEQAQEQPSTAVHSFSPPGPVHHFPLRVVAVAVYPAGRRAGGQA